MIPSHAMGESFVDVSYRGLELGKRLKLRDVVPEAGYVEIPLPMPVGTEIELVTDEGLKIAAHVTQVHEQVAGAAAHPGMRIKPHLGGAAVKWWQARIDAGAVAAEEAAARAKAEAEARATKAAEERAKIEAEAARLATLPGNKATMVMSTDAVKEALAAGEAVEGYVDDGQKTEAMAAVDLEALGISGDVKSTTVMDSLDISMITGEPPPEVGASHPGEDDEAEISVEDDEGGEVSGEMPITPSGRVVAGNGKKRGGARRSKKTKIKK
jgi:hypothetical protein